MYWVTPFSANACERRNLKLGLGNQLPLDPLPGLLRLIGLQFLKAPFLLSLILSQPPLVLETRTYVCFVESRINSKIGLILD